MDEPNQPPSRSDRGSALIAAAIVVASLILYWGMPGPAPRYQIAASGAAVMRLDTDSGEIIACDARQCTRITEPDRAKTLKLFEGGARPQPALPRPSNSS
jgi:hypothetical protein